MMKITNLIFPIVIFGALAVGAVSCGQTKTEKILAARTDSIHQADSIAAEEAAREEQARQDSIEQEAREKQQFEDAIPSVLEIDRKLSKADFEMTKLASWLKGKGFTMSTKTKTGYDERYEEYYTKTMVTFTLKKGDRKCVITNDCGNWHASFMVTIKGAPEFWKTYSEEGLKAINQIKRDDPSDWTDYWWIKKKGNSIIVSTHWCD